MVGGRSPEAVASRSAASRPTKRPRRSGGCPDCGAPTTSAEGMGSITTAISSKTSRNSGGRSRAASATSSSKASGSNQTGGGRRPGFDRWCPGQELVGAVVVPLRVGEDREVLEQRRALLLGVEAGEAVPGLGEAPAGRDGCGPRTRPARARLRPGSARPPGRLARPPRSRRARASRRRSGASALRGRAGPGRGARARPRYAPRPGARPPAPGKDLPRGRSRRPLPRRHLSPRAPPAGPP